MVSVTHDTFSRCRDCNGSGAITSLDATVEFTCVECDGTGVSRWYTKYPIENPVSPAECERRARAIANLFGSKAS